MQVLANKMSLDTRMCRYLTLWFYAKTMYVSSKNAAPLNYDGMYRYKKESWVNSQATERDFQDFL